jgi:hypothetical protein
VHTACSGYRFRSGMRDLYRGMLGATRVAQIVFGIRNSKLHKTNSKLSRPTPPTLSCPDQAVTTQSCTKTNSKSVHATQSCTKQLRVAQTKKELLCATLSCMYQLSSLGHFTAFSVGSPKRFSAGGMEARGGRKIFDVTQRGILPSNSELHKATPFWSVQL